MLLTELLKQSGQSFQVPQEIPNIEILGIQSDSRKVKKGDLFIALEGGSTDGHEFIHSAIDNGAGAIVGRKELDQPGVIYIKNENPRKTLAYLAAALNGNPARCLTMIGVTGTDGKTTTVNLIFKILLACGIKAGMISTVNAVIGSEVIDTGFHVTTPDAIEIQSLLRKMVDNGITHVVLETTSHGLDQFRVDACEFDVAVITNITHEHLDYHGDYEGYLNAKFKLFDMLIGTQEKIRGNPRLAIFNRDDISYLQIKDRLNDASYHSISKFTYGLSDDVQIQANNILYTPEGLDFNIDIFGKSYRVTSPLIGNFNIYNILAAISATAVALQLKIDCVLEGIRSMAGVPGRMELITSGQDFMAFVDFAHTPNALKAALQTARQLTKGRLIVVFGSAGLRDREKRRMMAEVSHTTADISIFTAEDPRTESLSAILFEMADEAKKHGGVLNKDYFIIEDRGEAIRKAVSLAGVDDIVMACGKGHEQSMCFGETEYPWDDRIAMRAALAERMHLQGPRMPWLPTQNI